MSITNIPANKNVGKSLGDINANFAYLDSENEGRKKELSDKLDKSAVDSTLSSESENPVQNKVVYKAIQNAGSKITVDNILDITSENPVQNKVITRELTNANQDISTLSARVKVLENGTDPDISADFLTEGGFGNLRYYNGHFQKYDANSNTWVDTTATPDNVYIFNMVPQAIKKISGTYDTDMCKYKLKFEAPDDTIIDGQLVCIVDKIIIRRKLGSAPENENDGDFIAEIKRREFGLYKNNWFVDNTLTPNLGDVYYYKAFPVSTLGHINYSTVNETRGLVCKEYFLFGFKINPNESDPASMITYLPDCDNAQFSPARMNYTTDTFDYGDWGGAWFIEKLKPCMLRYDGTVDYELDRNDYTKKADGTASDVANTAYGGNAMMGIPKVYWKVVGNSDGTTNVYICDTKIDDDFVSWSHIDNNGNEIDYCYMSIYDGTNLNSQLRSLSGLSAAVNMSRYTEVDYALVNNTGSDVIWYTAVYSDIVLINLLLLLIGKSGDCQTIFGNGRMSGGIAASGALNSKGLFWGSQIGSESVKVFGIENFWGNIWKTIAGFICDKGTLKTKLTYGQSDGSTVDGYNFDGSGYISLNTLPGTGTTGSYISKMVFSKYGLIPSELNGSSSTYYCDGIMCNPSTVAAYGMINGAGDFGSMNYVGGPFCMHLWCDASYQTGNTGTCLSCKPLAAT